MGDLLCGNCQKVEPVRGGWCEPCLEKYRANPEHMYAEFKERPANWPPTVTPDTVAEDIADTLVPGTVITEPAPFVEALFRGESRGWAKWMTRSQGDAGGIDKFIGWLRPVFAERIFEEHAAAFGQDDYLSIATYNTRKTGSDDHLDRVTAVIADLDIHKADDPLTTEDAFAAILDASLPPPSILMDTGEGVAALWLLRRGESRRPPKFVANRAENLGIHATVGNEIRRVLHEHEPRLMPDPSSAGLRMIRPPGSVNTGSGRKVSAVMQGTDSIPLYTLDDLERDLRLGRGGYARAEDSERTPERRKGREAMLTKRLDWLLGLRDHRAEHGWPDAVAPETSDIESRKPMLNRPVEMWLVYYIRTALALHLGDVKKTARAFIADHGLTLSEAKLDKLLGGEGARCNRHTTNAHIGRVLRVTADEAIEVGVSKGFFPHTPKRRSDAARDRLRLRAVVISLWESEGPMPSRKLAERLTNMGRPVSHRKANQLLKDAGLVE